MNKKILLPTAGFKQAEMVGEYAISLASINSA